MGFLVDMWMPILASAAAVWVVSSILHIVLPFHKSDYVGMPGEDAIRDALCSNNITVGEYMFPHAESMAELAEPEMIEKFTQGPVGIMTILPSGPPPWANNCCNGSSTAFSSASSPPTSPAL